MKLFSIALLALYGLVIFLLIGSLYLGKSGVAVDPNIIVAAVVGTTTLGGYLLQRHFERAKIIEQEIRDKKIPVYNEFIDFFTTAVFEEGKMDQEQMTETIHKFNKKCLVWFSDKNLRTYIKWIKHARSEVASSEKNDAALTNFLIVEKMLFEFRKEIGHSNSGLNKGDLLSIYITDLEKSKINKLSKNI